uniref:Uncharacterized protein n=1 Tax=Noccaea caerulescens TaxID=107243 RepID=A0A1J3DHS9_NOCCA
MNQCSLGIDGLSPSARPFPIGSPSSSFSVTASKSEHEESIWGDYNLDLSFLSSDDQRSALDTDDSLSNLSRDAETTKEGQILEDAIVLSNPNPVSSKLPELLIESSKDAGDDSEEDTPCWIGILSRKNLSPGAKSVVISRRSTDDLSGFHQLNPLAPQFIPSSAKMKLDKNGTEFEENGSSSLKRSLSSTFPPSSGEFGITDPSGAGVEQDYSQKNNRTDESLGLVSQDSVSEAMSMLDISSRFQTPKKLDPLAPVFVPANAKLSAVVNEKHGVADHMVAIERNAHSTYALSSSDDMLPKYVEVETHSSDVGRILGNAYSSNACESGKAYSFSPRLRSQVQISENTKQDSSSGKSHGRKKLNPLARQFSLADTKQKVYGCEENQAVNGLPPMVNSSVLLSPVGYRNHEELSSLHVEPSFNEVNTKVIGRLHPNILRGSSSRKSQPSKETLPFHILESSNRVKASSDFGHRHGCSTSSDVKKLLTTIHGLSELLTHVHGSETDSPNEQDLDLINCTMQNLNSYINNRVQEHTGNYASAVDSSCDFKPLPNMRTRSIRDHQLPRAAQNMALNTDFQRKEYSMVSGNMDPMVPVSHFEFGATQENGFGKVTGNYQTEEQINPHALFYRSLWLKAKADRSLMEYETFLSKTRNLSN